MNINNDLIVGGKVTAEDGLNVLYVVSVPPSGTNTLTIDWNRGNSWLVDLRSKPGEVIAITFTNGNQNAENYRVIYVQPSTPCTVSITVPSDSILTPVHDTALMASTNTANAIKVFDYVYDGIPVSSVNGIYHLNNSVNSSYSENDIYSGWLASIGGTSLKVLVDTEVYSKSLARLDVTLGKLIPAIPSELSAMSLNIISAKTAGTKKASDGTAVAQLALTDNVSFSITGGTAANRFFDPESGNLSVNLKTNAGSYSSVGQITLTTSDDSGTTGALTISSNPSFDAFSRVIATAATIAIGSLPATSASLYTVQLAITSSTRNSSSGIVAFNRETLGSAVVPSAASITVGSALPKVSGIAALKTGGTRQVTATLPNVVTDYYNAARIATVSSAEITSVDVTVSGAQTANTPLSMAATTVTVLAGSYSNSFQPSVTSYRIDGSSNGSLAATSVNPILLDSVTNTSLFGYDHTTSLKTVRTSDLMILNGIVQYPNGDFSGYDDGTGTAIGSNYNYNSSTGTRFIQQTVGSFSAIAGIKVTFNNQTGWANQALETSSTYQLQVSYVHPTLGAITINGNLAYPGTGIPQSNSGALDVSQSTQSLKVITFGQVVSFANNIVIKLSLNGVALSFGQNISITTF